MAHLRLQPSRRGCGFVSSSGGRAGMPRVGLTKREGVHPSGHVHQEVAKGARFQTVHKPGAAFVIGAVAADRNLIDLETGIGQRVDQLGRRGALF
jgi:hypothetical protein